MSHYSPWFVMHTALLLGGCASGAGVNPTAANASANVEQSASELVARGREAAKRGDAVRAEQYLGFAIEQGADRRAVMPILLQACLKSSHLRAALNHAEPYLLEHPEDDALRYLVASIHLGLGQVVLARRELGLLLQRNERNADAHYLLGVIESVTDLDSARKHYLAAVEYTSDEEQRVEMQSRLAELRLREREEREAQVGLGGEEP